jgi:CDP-diacylglycerol--serine O-phosphatidyltransferase
MSESLPPPSRPSRGIYLLPNLFTTGGLFAGFYAIIAASAGNYVDACIAVFVAGLLDGLDGRIARLTGTQSEFGVQYDSLADLVSFGMAPALVMYHWGLSSLKFLGPAWGKVGWAAAFLYAACAALRLARFNTQVGVIDKRWFIGLASPAAAAVMMATIWVMADHGIGGGEVKFVALGVTVVAALLMVSRVRYYSFKSLPLADRVPFVTVLLALGVFVALAIDPPHVLLAIAGAYLLSGPVTWIWNRARRGRNRPPPAA